MQQLQDTEINAPAVGAEFFAPANTSLLDILLGQYRQTRGHIEAVAAFMEGKDMSAAAGFFLAACEERFTHRTPSAADLFNAEEAVKALDAHYWARALDLTDVREYMPAARRWEWAECIRAHKTPEFAEATVKATLESLLAKRLDFLAERVDGIFIGLSGEHVTNRPEGFSKRMIVAGVFEHYALITGRNADLIHDLRAVIAKLVGRDHPYIRATRSALYRMRETPGEWHALDGNALRVRLYKKGTAHLEVHPEIAWQLNRILAHLHPAAIPARHRRRPARRTRTREIRLIDQPIPFAVLERIDEARYSASDGHVLTLSYQWTWTDKHLRRSVADVIQAIGGVDGGDGVFRFDYDASGVIGELLSLGAIPDRRSHQYYPTPRWLAEEVVRLADIGETDLCLEPSAGQGAIAELMPADRTLCIEISALHCRVLAAKGYKAHEKDFLHWGGGQRFDVICMNPPFSEGRAKTHLERAAELLAPGGRLVAVLPASLAGKDLLPGMNFTCSSVYDGAFAHASVSVVILAATKPVARQEQAA